MKLLIAEDEKDLNDIIAKKLRAENFSVECVYNGEDAYHYLSAAPYDAAILDIMMPGMDGLETVRRLRADGIATPVLFLTARDTVADKVKGLNTGASDYLVKPFSFDELIARIYAVTRTAAGIPSSALSIADLTVDVQSHTVTRAGREITLTAKEFALLEYLVRNQNRVLSRQKIEDHVWNFDYEGGTNVVDVYITYLRKKIDEGFSSRLIHTVRGVGYMMKEEKK